MNKNQLALLVSGLSACTPTDSELDVEPGMSGASGGVPDADPGGASGAVRALMASSYARRTELLAAVDGELAVIQRGLDHLGAKVGRVSGAAAADARARLEFVRLKWAAAKVRLDAASAATEEGWSQAQMSFREALFDLRGAFTSTREWLSVSLEPAR